MMKFIALVAAVVALSTAANAATVTWTGYGSACEWSLGVNWNTNSVPGAQDDVVIHNSSCAIQTPNAVAINSLVMGDRLEAKATLEILNTFQVFSTFHAYQNGVVSVTSGASALNGQFQFDGPLTFSAGSVTGTVTVSGAADLSSAASKSIVSGSLTLSGTSKVGGVISLDGTAPTFVVSGSSSWNNVHLMPTPNATKATFDASKGSVDIESDVAIQANGKFGGLTLADKTNLTLYSNVSFNSALNIPNASWVFTIGSAVTNALISGGGNFVAGGASTTFGDLSFDGMIACSGVSCTFGGKKATVGNLVSSAGMTKVSSGASLSAALLSIQNGQFSVAGACSATELNFLGSGMLTGNIQATNFYVKNNAAFNLMGAISVATGANFAGASLSFGSSGGIHLAKGSNSEVSGTLALSGPPAAMGISNNGNLNVKNAITSTNVNFKGDGPMTLGSSITLSGGEFGAGKVTMSSGASVKGNNACVNVAAFSATQVKAKIDAVSFTCQGACTEVNAPCSPMPTDSFSFSA